MEKKARIHSIETFGALDGPGIRYVLFLQGCPLRCLYCHNPDTWHPNGGRLITLSETFDDILRYRNFIARGGVTLSGGEPLLQADFCEELLDFCHENHIHTAIDTAGSLPLSTCLKAVDSADLILLDIKSLNNVLHRKITGLGNENCLALLNHREETGKPVWIRHVLVPGLTLKEPLLEELARFLKGYTCIQKVELLPFHKMGEYKWAELNAAYSLADTLVPTAEEVKRAKEIFISHGLPL